MTRQRELHTPVVGLIVGAQRPGIAQEHVDAAVESCDRLHERENRREVARVECVADGLTWPACPVDLVGRLAGTVRAARGEVDLGAEAHQIIGDGPADPAAAAREDGTLAGQVGRHPRPSERPPPRRVADLGEAADDRPLEGAVDDVAEGREPTHAMRAPSSFSAIPAAALLPMRRNTMPMIGSAIFFRNPLSSRVAS